MATQLLRLVSNQLKVGSVLPFSVRDEHGKLLLARGQLLRTEHQIEVLLARGLYVDQEEMRRYREGDTGADRAKRLSLFDLWEQAIWQLDRLHKSIDAGPGFADRCEEFATLLEDLIERDADIAIYLSVRQDARRLHLYGLTHAVHCTLVCKLMGQRIGWERAHLHTMMKAALTMNIAVTELQGRFAAIGRLTDAQRAQMHEHPTRAVELLRAAGVTDELWLQAVQDHHERAGGSGYPRGLAAVSEAALALRMADVFMAKISARNDRPPLSVQDAARQMFAEAQGHPAAAAVIKEYGIYPPGNLVQLASGEQAVVIRRGATAHAPLVAALTDRGGMPVATPHRRDTAQPGLAIRGVLADSPAAQRVPPERLYGLVP